MTTPVERHKAALELFENGLVYFPRIGVTIRATPRGMAHAVVDAETPEQVADALIASQLASGPGYATRRKWPLGQGQQPGMIDNSPEGRRILVMLLIVAAALVLAIVAGIFGLLGII